MMKPYHNKTGRVRGLVWGHIRQVATRRKTFTLCQVVTPSISAHRAQQNLAAMVRAGQLLRTKGLGRSQWLYARVGPSHAQSKKFLDQSSKYDPTRAYSTDKSHL